jgi:hypothetical protein
LNIDGLPAGNYTAKALITWNVTSDIERSYNFRIYSTSAIPITDRDGKQGFSLLSLPEVWNQEASFMDTKRAQRAEEPEEKTEKKGLMSSLFKMFGAVSQADMYKGTETDNSPAENYKFLDPFDQEVLEKMGENNQNGPVTFIILKNAESKVED